ncbi:NUDIX domain-containing protein [Sphingomonas guangdongensis]|uniref:NUDIX domain-containing protein n=1 Tax=Sphingomonas guangdongensis TaxID=1141890 RepID=A0A285QB01_9SPHN|nr:NUDIX domain-containing protein [Sphingomonas guangdongensis]SOB78619.1 NUDIX domain-containing protein [Sphingomonas guangdongensis]
MSDESPIPAATVIVMREGAGAPELLMLERSRAMRFAGGALVFPGGRIDAGDQALGGHDESAARIAATREAIEEAGIAPAVVPAPTAVRIAAMREQLHGGATIGAVLKDEGIDLDQLVPFARWLPLGLHARVFDTRFYLTRWDDRAPEPSVDGTENSRLFWTTAAEVLADAAAGRASLIFPTRRTLERLARYRSFNEAVADARAHPIRTVTPWVEARNGVDHLCIPDDLGYPVTAEPLASVRRA